MSEPLGENPPLTYEQFAQAQGVCESFTAKPEDVDTVKPWTRCSECSTIKAFHTT